MSYTSENIKVLSGLDPVRELPGMYIGDVGQHGLHQIFYEVIDNSIDEHLGGFCDKISVELFADGSIAVEDNGRGIPVDTHKEQKKSALEVVLTTLHAGGKFEKEKNGIISGGLHGVGISVTCALTTWMVAQVFRDGKIYEFKMARGKKVSKAVEVTGKTSKKGTRIHFLPDPTIFKETTTFDLGIIRNRLRETTFLNPGLTITLAAPGEEIQTFHSVSGIKDYLMSLTEGKPLIYREPILIEGPLGHHAKSRVEIAFIHWEGEESIMYSFVNNINTSEHGTHVSGFKNALTRAINIYGRKTDQLRKTLGGDDIRDGLLAVVSIRLLKPSFQSQIKTKLINHDVEGLVSNLVTEQLKSYFDAHPTEAKAIIAKGLLAMRARESATLAKQQVRRKSLTDRTMTLPGKLHDCSSTNPEETMLFLVEGDSAGGSARGCRDSRTQAILPLRGKVLNVEGKPAHKIIQSEQIANIVEALGIDLLKPFDPSKLRYGKLMLMADGDVDGSHITILLLTLIFRNMRAMIDEGRVYLCQPPLFGVLLNNGEKSYFYNDADLAAYLKNHPNPKEVRRYKGLGEMDKDELWETTMDPRRAHFIQVTITDAAKAEQMFAMLMGKDESEDRRTFIMAKAAFAQNIDI